MTFERNDLLPYHLLNSVMRGSNWENITLVLLCSQVFGLVTQVFDQVLATNKSQQMAFLDLF